MVADLSPVDQLGMSISAGLVILLSWPSTSFQFFVQQSFAEIKYSITKGRCSGSP